MRRSTAISQAVLLLALYVVPLFASSSVALPACCRREGAHHCAMQEGAADHQRSFSSAVHCPYRFPAIVLTHTTKLFFSPASVATALPGSHELLLHDRAGYVLAQVAASLDNRGPPTPTL